MEEVAHERNIQIRNNHNLSTQVVHHADSATFANLCKRANENITNDEWAAYVQELSSNADRKNFLISQSN